MSIRTESIKRVLRIEGRVPDTSSLVLVASVEAKAFHCSSCGKFLFNRQHRIIAITDDLMNHSLNQTPITLQCAKCGHRYKINVI